MSQVFLQPGKEKRLRSGHLWVYRGEIADIRGEVVPGDIVDVYSHNKQFCGRGYINPDSTITVRLLTRLDEPIDESFFRRRLETAVSYRQEILPIGAESYRVVFSEGDLLPGLVVDKFSDILVLQALTAGIDRFKHQIAAILSEIMPVSAVYERSDVSSRRLEGLELVSGWLRGQGSERVLIRENELEFEVDLSAGQKTGFFLDQRENHAAVKPFVNGRRVLDAFCHLGGFGLHAAFYGAREVIGLDISETAIAAAKENAARNGVSERCGFQAGNAFDELRRMEKEGEQFDFVILDPPAFTKSKSALPGAIRGYKEINLRGFKLLPRGGYLVTCSCSYHMTEDIFAETVFAAARDAGRQVRLVEKRAQAKDHPILWGVPETHYLKCLILQVVD